MWVCHCLRCQNMGCSSVAPVPQLCQANGCQLRLLVAYKCKLCQQGSTQNVWEQPCTLPEPLQAGACKGCRVSLWCSFGMSGVWEAVQTCWTPDSCTELRSAKCCRPSWKGKCVTRLLHVGIKAAVRLPSSTATFVLGTAAKLVRDTQCRSQTARLLAGPP